MRRDTDAQRPSPDSLLPASDPIYAGEERLYVRVGPPDASWSHAKWLALADQALQE